MLRKRAANKQQPDVASSIAVTRQGEGRKPDFSALLSALKKCSRSRDLRAGIRLHSQAAAADLLCNKFLASSFINMYAKCGSMVEAQKIFDDLQHRDVVCWNSLINGYVENGKSELALELFDRMTKQGCFPDDRSFLAAISACATLAASETTMETATNPDKKFICSSSSSRWLIRGEDIHSEAVKNRFCTVFVKSSVVEMYARCGKMFEARKVFDNMKRRNVVVWTSLLQGYVEIGEAETALDLFDRLQQNQQRFSLRKQSSRQKIQQNSRLQQKNWLRLDQQSQQYEEEEEEDDFVTPDERLYVVALKACSALSAKATTRRRWQRKGRSIHSAAVMDGCCNIFVQNTLLDLYSKCRSLDLAREVFSAMVRRDVVAWTAAITGCVENDESELALELASAMDLPKNSLTFVAALAACGSLMALETGRNFHREVENRGLEKQLIVANSLVDFYSKCGSMDHAKRVFDSIDRKTVVSWTSLIFGYGLQGDSAMALEIFRLMGEQEVQPNEVTFVGVLIACSHAGLTERGREIFKAMEAQFGVRRSLIHYCCMVDLLGRTNCIEEAMKMVREMPWEANGVVWRAVLGACAKWRNVEAGRIAYEALLRLEDQEEEDEDDCGGAFVLMANLYEIKARSA